MDYMNNENLTWKAKGILAALIAKQEDESFTLADLSRCSTDGKTSIASAISELKEAGFLKIERKKNEDGRFCGSKFTLIKELTQ